jgi:AcrR family transcriptional regulator
MRTIHAVPSPRAAQAASTRDRIMSAAERLYAEHGVVAVSNRQISEAAGQGNNAAVGYHFGTKTDLIQAIMLRHTTRMERHRTALFRRYEGSDDLRDWIAVGVLPVTLHLAELGTPSWYARFSAQIVTDPALRHLSEDAIGQDSILRASVAETYRCLPDLPDDVRAERTEMARALVTYTCADREASTGGGSSWDAIAAMLIDALYGLLTAPVTDR